MQVLSATAAHHAGIKLVIIKSLETRGIIVVTDPRTGTDYSLYLSKVTTVKLYRFAERQGYTKDHQLVGAELTTEPLHTAGGKAIGTYFWEPRLPA
jgi:hypothetical protein